MAEKPLTRSQIMSRIRGKDTKGELEIRKRLRKAGLPGYRLQWTKEWRIDVAFPGKKIAIFYDSCFWHQCPEHFRMPKSNVDFWREKFKKGSKRKWRIDRELREAGWTVVRVWGHDLESWSPESEPALKRMMEEKWAKNTA